jgi:hypothetical protein
MEKYIYYFLSHLWANETLQINHFIVLFYFEFSLLEEIQPKFGSYTGHNMGPTLGNCYNV